MNSPISWRFLATFVCLIVSESPGMLERDRFTLLLVFLTSLHRQGKQIFRQMVMYGNYTVNG